MNLLLIEDEPPAAQRLIRLLTELEPTARVLAVLDSISQSLDWFRQHGPGQVHYPDLILSDIHLADGLSFEIFRQVDVACPIIFTTAYDEYAIQAFKLNSLDYLLKPILADDLRAALAKFHRNRASHAPKPSLTMTDAEVLLRNLVQQAGGTAPTYRQRFLVSHKESFLPVSATEIAYFYSENKVTRLVRSDGRWFALPETLDQVAEQLDPRFFFRANRQFILHADSIEGIHKHFNGKLKLLLRPTPTEEVMVSRERADEFKQWLNQ
jgi:two-component system, LytTR family, response regulator LytT